MDPKPFDSPDADVALRTKDGTILKVYSRIITIASPFFRDLFSLPQPASEEGKDDSIPIIDVSESSEVIHALLTFIYPIEDPPVNTLLFLSDVLEAALKYDLTVAVQRLRGLLVSPQFSKTEPVKVFAIACRLRLEEEMKLASSHTLAVNILGEPITEELKYITAFDYRRLIDLHRTRAKTAQNIIDDRSGTSSYCRGCGLIPKWWADWLTRAKEELQQRPTTEVIFSLPFLVTSTKAGCSQCGSGFLERHDRLFAMKQQIDALPATI